MFNKNIFLVLITIFTYLNFITCATGENLSISKKTGDTVTSISTSISSEKEDDFENAIQFVINKFSALDQKSIDSLESFDDVYCDCSDSDSTAIIICEEHSKTMEFWKKLFAKDEKINCTCKKNKKSFYWHVNVLFNIRVGIFCKYFYNSDYCKDGSTVKKCGCKILKNTTTECMEVCLCKKHFKILEAWKNPILELLGPELMRRRFYRPGNEWLK